MITWSCDSQVLTPVAEEGGRLAAATGAITTTGETEIAMETTVTRDVRRDVMRDVKREARSRYIFLYYDRFVFL